MREKAGGEIPALAVDLKEGPSEKIKRRESSIRWVSWGNHGGYYSAFVLVWVRCFLWASRCPLSESFCPENGYTLLKCLSGCSVVFSVFTPPPKIHDYFIPCKIDGNAGTKRKKEESMFVWWEACLAEEKEYVLNWDPLVRSVFENTQKKIPGNFFVTALELFLRIHITRKETLESGSSAQVKHICPQEKYLGYFWRSNSWPVSSETKLKSLARKSCQVHFVWPAKAHCRINFLIFAVQMAIASCSLWCPEWYLKDIGVAKGKLEWKCNQWHCCKDWMEMIRVMKVSMPGGIVSFGFMKPN